MQGLSLPPIFYTKKKPASMVMLKAGYTPVVVPLGCTPPSCIVLLEKRCKLCCGVEWSQKAALWHSSRDDDDEVNHWQVMLLWGNNYGCMMFWTFHCDWGHIEHVDAVTVIVAWPVGNFLVPPQYMWAVQLHPLEAQDAGVLQRFYTILC